MIPESKLLDYALSMEHLLERDLVPVDNFVFDGIRFFDASNRQNFDSPLEVIEFASRVGHQFDCLAQDSFLASTLDGYTMRQLSYMFAAIGVAGLEWWRELKGEEKKWGDKEYTFEDLKEVRDKMIERRLTDLEIAKIEMTELGEEILKELFKPPGKTP